MLVMISDLILSKGGGGGVSKARFEHFEFVVKL